MNNPALVAWHVVDGGTHWHSSITQRDADIVWRLDSKVRVVQNSEGGTQRRDLVLTIRIPSALIRGSVEAAPSHRSAYHGNPGLECLVGSAGITFFFAELSFEEVLPATIALYLLVVFLPLRRISSQY